VLFNSFPYLLWYLPIVLVVCLLCRAVFGLRTVQAWILIASIFFYGWSSPTNLIYLAISITANWIIASWIFASPVESVRRKRILRFGLLLNVGFLSSFKYLNLLLSSFTFILPLKFRLPDLGFPLGISFFTVTQIMYLVDVYEELIPASSLFDHATFVSFFPYVISGPLSRAGRIIPQFPKLGGSTGERSARISRGVYHFSLGLFKKVVLADAFARIANFGYANVASLTSVEAWLVSIAYVLQIYFDFSGYSDMAIGTACMLNIDLPRNFDAPLRSLSLIEFWQRWHISLTGFITTYLYTPILKSFKKATLVTASIATLASMGIAGLWHGPSWNFVLFGLIHGVGLVVNQVWRKKKLPKPFHPLSWFLTFLLVNVAFIFFRSPTIPAAIHLLGRLVSVHQAFGFQTLSTVAAATGMKMKIFGGPLLLGVILAFYGKSSEERAREFVPSYANSLLAAASVLVSCLFMNSSVAAPFVYFKF
jgi:alginate O-acetyltransferase complex protein AlgI